MKIAVAGTGYVGLSNALLLSQHNDVWAVDILQSKIDLINKGKSPIVDREIEEFLAREDLHLTATTDAEKAYKVLILLSLQPRRTTIRRKIISTHLRLKR